MPAFFRAKADEFLDSSIEDGMTMLTGQAAAHGFELKPDQFEAWLQQWDYLQALFRETLPLWPGSADWIILLEYEIAGRRKRLDAVVLTDARILAIEFKVGASKFGSADRWQLREYCWNLRDFHHGSRDAPIAPILVATNAPQILSREPLEFSDRGGVILDMVCCGAETLAAAFERCYSQLKTRGIWGFDAEAWDHSSSAPTPTVIDCARRLFEGHDVREIAHAQGDNTDAALSCLREAVTLAKDNRKRVICFVTGVPGAGQTLVGLNAAYRREMIETAGGPVCFASGNQPLLEVLQAALVMNRARDSKLVRETAFEASVPIRNVHDFALSTILSKASVSPYNVVVFDEAQRVWSADKLRSGLEKRRRRRQLTTDDLEELSHYGTSEPELLLGVMEKCDWCVVIALIGGGQEIHEGEAGLAEWGRALIGREAEWEIWVAPQAIGIQDAAARQDLFVEENVPQSVRRTPALHLDVSKRSFRAERYSEWVNRVIDGDRERALEIAKELSEYPILLTRDLITAKALLRDRASGDLRMGLLASSGAIRLRAEGIEVSPSFRGSVNWPDWFLRLQGDIRGSSQLEVAATEFECQGLELDWCGICWGGDFVVLPEADDWQARRVRTPARKTPRWYLEKSAERQEFVRNKYRVLLTRGREGVIIFVPKGDERDETRQPNEFDSTAQFLISCGATRHTLGSGESN